MQQECNHCLGGDLPTGGELALDTRPRTIYLKQEHRQPITWKFSRSIVTLGLGCQPYT